MSKYMQGYFKPQNPHKYKGDPTNIIYRSSWELKLMGHLDRHDKVVVWSSEEIRIPYRSPMDNRIHTYYPDFLVTKLNENGKKETMLIEIKPSKQTTEPKNQSKVTRKFLTEVKTWGVNQAKWKAAESYCLDRGWTFHIFTEKHLGIING